MDYLAVRNWKTWQTYRNDRGQPPWIKVHRALLRDWEWIGLTDAERGQLVVIWLLAADHDGVVPASPRRLRVLGHMESEPDLDRFIELGFLIQIDAETDATVTPSGRHPDVEPAPKRRPREVQSSSETHCANSGDKPDKNCGTGKANGKDFDRFWQAYPKKINKKKAMLEFRTHNFTTHDVDELIADIKARQAKDGAWKRGYAPDPKNYLEGHRWEDEYAS